MDDAIRSLDLDDLESRAGRHSWGYTEPSEAAGELLQEVVDPFLEDLKRRMDLGLVAEAMEVCKGILLGLYSGRSSSGSFFFIGQFAVLALLRSSGLSSLRAPPMLRV